MKIEILKREHLIMKCLIAKKNYYAIELAEIIFNKIRITEWYIGIWYDDFFIKEINPRYQELKNRLTVNTGMGCYFKDKNSIIILDCIYYIFKFFTNIGNTFEKNSNFDAIIGYV